MSDVARDVREGEKDLREGRVFKYEDVKREQAEKRSRARTESPPREDKRER